MFNKNTAIKINTVVLFVLGLVDILRGFMHTFNINWAAANIAKMDSHPDALFLIENVEELTVGVLDCYCRRVMLEMSTDSSFSQFHDTQSAIPNHPHTSRTLSFYNI